MSLKTWKAEFYPVSASTAARKGKVAAIEHSIQKWKGLTKANMKKHKVKHDSYGVFDMKDEDAFMADEHLAFTDDTCALCKKYYHSSLGITCGSCPLFQVVGVSCGDGYGDPFSAFVDDGNPQPMIRALTKALKRTQQEQK